MILRELFDANKAIVHGTDVPEYVVTLLIFCWSLDLTSCPNTQEYIDNMKEPGISW